MKCKIPSDLTTADLRAAYRRGWDDRGKASAAKAGRTPSDAKAAAARSNGAKGGRPRKREGQ